MLDSLDFVYTPSRDVAADVAHLVAACGGEAVFAVARFGTRVAMVRLSQRGPALVLAEHLHGDQPVNVFQVPDLEQAITDLQTRSFSVGDRFEFPFGGAVEIHNPGPQRIAIYQRTQGERGESLTGRFDFPVS